MPGTDNFTAIPDTFSKATASVFGAHRTIKAPDISLPKSLPLNRRVQMDGLQFLSLLPAASFAVAFFDPQYRGVLNKMGYGNEGKERGKRRCSLPQMSEQVIGEFISGINTVLIPSGHLFLWIDKFHLCQGFSAWLDDSSFDVVDMIVWNKRRMGMGYRSRRVSEYLMVLQKPPRRAKGAWKVHNIPDVWDEKLVANGDKSPHRKPLELQRELIAAVSNEEDIVIDPAAGSFSVMEAARLARRNFVGCDVNA